MNIKCHACTGGPNLREDIRKLEYGQHVVAGTPNRVFDMIRRRNISTWGIKVVIFEDINGIVNNGFKDQMHDIYRYLPSSIQGL